MSLSLDQQRAIAIAEARQRQFATREQAPVTPKITAEEPSFLGITASDIATATGVPQLTPEVVEPAATMATGMAAEPIAGVAGMAAAATPFLEPGAGARAVESTREALTYQPRTEAGQAGLQAVGELVEPVTEALGAAEEFLGETTLEATGSPALAAIAKTIPTALGEAIGAAGIVAGAKGAKSIKQVSDSLKEVEGLRREGVRTAKKTAPDSWLFDYETPTKKVIREAIENNPTDNITAKYMIDGSGKVKTDPVARDVIKQGFDEGLVAAIKGSQPADKTAMTKMLDIVEKGKKNRTYARKNRPSDVIGDSILKRFKSVRDANSQAGKRLDSVAQGLKGKQVNSSNAVSGFLDDLDNMGISIDENFKPSFSGSDIEGVPAAENAIRKVATRLKKMSDSGDAYDAHRMKRFIDEQVSYGKAGEGLTGKSEQVIKRLRRNVDGELDAEFPEYNEVNTQYSDTITALDDFKKAAGSNFDPLSPGADKFVGNLSRRLLSNVQSRVKLMDSISELEDVSRKYGKVFDDDIFTQAMFVDEIENVFGSFAPTSLQGVTEKAITQGARAVTDSAAETAIKAVSGVAKRLTGGSEEKAIKSMRKLLSGK